MRSAAHPNVRVFVTHGGLLSTQESIHHGVPVVGIPLFGDQRFNMAIAKSKGWGVTVDFLSITQEALQAALKEVLENPRYVAVVVWTCWNIARAWRCSREDVQLRARSGWQL